MHFFYLKKDGVSITTCVFSLLLLSSDTVCDQCDFAYVYCEYRSKKFSDCIK